MNNQKIKQDNTGSISKNIKEIPLSKGIGQTELVRKAQPIGVPLTRETLVKLNLIFNIFKQFR